MTTTEIPDDVVIGKVYEGNDGHKRTVTKVEFHYGNMQVQAHDTWLLKTEWYSLRDWYRLLEPKEQAQP